MGRRRLGRRAWKAAGDALARLWWGVRQASGDAAYEVYLRGRSASGQACADRAERSPLSRREFDLESLRRRYSGISRCC